MKKKSAKLGKVFTNQYIPSLYFYKKMKKLFFISFLKSLTALKCWSCDSKSHLECFIYGREKTCSGRDVRKFFI